jgi:hypothetical protein
MSGGKAGTVSGSETEENIFSAFPNRKIYAPFLPGIAAQEEVQ